MKFKRGVVIGADIIIFIVVVSVVVLTLNIFKAHELEIAKKVFILEDETNFFLINKMMLNSPNYLLGKELIEIDGKKHVRVRMNTISFLILTNPSPINGPYLILSEFKLNNFYYKFGNGSSICYPSYTRRITTTPVLIKSNRKNLLGSFNTTYERYHFFIDVTQKSKNEFILKLTYLVTCEAEFKYEIYQENNIIKEGSIKTNKYFNTNEINFNAKLKGLKVKVYPIRPYFPNYYKEWRAEDEK